MSDQFDVAGSNVDAVKKHVADNPDQLQAVLDAEKARGDSARSTLVKHLEDELANVPQFTEPAPVTVAPAAVVNPEEPKVARVAGQEYTVDPLKGYRVKAGREV